MTSLTSVQTKGVKRALTEESSALLFDAPDASKNVNGVAGAKKRQRWIQKEEEEEREEEEGNSDQVDDCNVIGLETREESSSDEEETCENDSCNQKECVATEEKEPEDKPPEDKAPLKEIQSTECVVLPECAIENSAPKRVSKPAVYVPVHRTAEVQSARLKLPILAEEQAIVEAINDNPVVILAGETGSGKTTQVNKH